MDIDLSVLNSLEAEKDISMDLAIKAIEDALLVAYHHTDGRRGHGPGRGQPRQPAMSPSGPRRRATTARWSGNTTTRPTVSAGSRPPPPGRSSCSGCATPRTS